MVATYGDFFATFGTHNIKILNDLGYEVHLCANWTNPEYNYKHDKLKGLRFKKINIEFDRSPTKVKNLMCYRELSRLMKINSYDLVDCHNAVIGVYARIAAKKNKVPNVMYTAHGFQFHKDGNFKDWMIYYPIEKYLSKFTDYLLVMNQEDYEYAKKFFSPYTKIIPGVGIDRKKIYNTSVSKNNYLDKLKLSYDDFIILSIGELSRRKNHKVVIDSIALLKNKKIKYLIAGKGETEIDLKKLANKLEVSDQILFLGYRDDIKELLKITDVAVFPSYREGLMIAGLESLASGTPIITANRKGINDYTLNGKNGYLFEPDDSKKLAEKINFLYENPKILEKMGEYAYKSVEKYDQEEVKEIMGKIYAEVFK